MKRWPFKDPDELLDYEVNWAARLGTDTISSVTWTVPSGIVKESEAASGAVVAIWLSGGTDGQTYNIGCRVVTSGGRTFDETIALPVRSR